MSRIDQIIRRCPNCKGWFTVQRVKRDLVDSHEDSANVWRRSPLVVDPYRGGVKGVNERQVELLTEEFVETYRCKRCMYTWTRTEVTERKVSG